MQDLPQHHTGLTKEAMQGVHYVLLSGAPGRTRAFMNDNPDGLIAQIPDSYQQERAMTWAILRDPVYGFKYGVMTTGMGTPSTEIFMAELLQTADNSAPLNIIRTGTAGTMQPYITVGDVAIASGAVRAEAVSYKYASHKGESYIPLASPDVVAALEVAAQRIPGNGYNHHVGPKITKDALWWEIFEVPMREQAKQFALQARDAGVVASAMESAIIYTMADRYEKGMIFSNGNPDRKVNVGTIVAIVNSPPKEGEEEKLFDDNPANREAAVNRVRVIAPEALRVLYENSNGTTDIVWSERRNHHNAQKESTAATIQDLEAKLAEHHPLW